MKTFYHVEVKIGEYYSRHQMRWPNIHKARARVRELKALGIISGHRIIKVTEEVVD